MYSFFFFFLFIFSEDKKSKKLLPPLMLRQLDNTDLHSQFETVFCKLIAQADPSSFGEVSKCRIDFTYSLSDAWGHHDNDNEPADYAGELRGEYHLSHVLKTNDMDDASMLESRITAIGNCFKDTYNMIHADSAYTFTDFTLEREIDIPENDDDDENFALAGPYRGLWAAKFGSWRGSYECRLCAPDDRKFVPPLMLARLTMGEHAAFEATFADCLRESGVPAFRKVTNPHLFFTYTGNGLVA